MGKNGLLLGALFVLVLITQFTVYADTVTLKSGAKIEGKITEKTDQYIKIEVAGLPVTYFLDEIEKIETGPVNIQGTPALTQPTNTTAADNIPPYTVLDKDAPEYAAIYAVLLNFVEHNNDRDPTQCMLSVSKEFKIEAKKGEDAMLGYDHFMQEQRDRCKDITSAVVKDFKINKIAVKDNLAKSTVSFKLEIQKTDGQKINTEPVWFFRLAKESEGWKIIQFVRLNKRDPGSPIPPDML